MRVFAVDEVPGFPAEGRCLATRRARDLAEALSPPALDATDGGSNTNTRYQTNSMQDAD